MRLPITFILSILFSYSSFACTCIPGPFCAYLDSLQDDERTLIFKGSFISEEPAEYGMAVQFKVDKLYSGKIITPASSLYIPNTLVNTDTTVWVFSGSTSSCHRHIFQNQAIFVLSYNAEPFNFLQFGYEPSSCINDYFPISEEGNVTCNLLGYDNYESIELSEFEEIIKSNCGHITNIDEMAFIKELVSIYPQPASEKINIDAPMNFSSWNIQLINAEGKHLKTIQEPSIDLSELNQGIYFLKFNKDGEAFIKKVIKI